MPVPAWLYFQHVVTMKKSEIIKRIADCGGLYGQIASKSINPENADNFIIECFDQCHNASVQELWGIELLLEILNYRLELIRKPLRELENYSKRTVSTGQLRHTGLSGTVAKVN